MFWKIPSTWNWEWFTGSNPYDSMMFSYKSMILIMFHDFEMYDLLKRKFHDLETPSTWKIRVWLQDIESYNFIWFHTKVWFWISPTNWSIWFTAPQVLWLESTSLLGRSVWFKYQLHLRRVWLLKSMICWRVLF